MAPADLFNRDRLAQFCRRWEIRELSLSGSVLREDFDEDSDIDVLVTYGPEVQWTLLDEVRMQQELTSIFGRKVDLVSRRAVERSANPVRRDAILGGARTIHVEG